MPPRAKSVKRPEPSAENLPRLTNQEHRRGPLERRTRSLYERVTAVQRRSAPIGVPRQSSYAFCSYRIRDLHDDKLPVIAD